jgi:hypothetical protein
MEKRSERAVKRPMKQLLVAIPVEEHRTFRIAAAERGLSLAEIVRPILEKAAQVLEAARKEHDPNSPV